MPRKYIQSPLLAILPKRALQIQVNEEVFQNCKMNKNLSDTVFGYQIIIKKTGEMFQNDGLDDLAVLRGVFRVHLVVQKLETEKHLLERPWTELVIGSEIKKLGLKGVDKKRDVEP